MGLDTKDEETEEEDEMQRSSGHDFEAKSGTPAREMKWVWGRIWWVWLKKKDWLGQREIETQNCWAQRCNRVSVLQRSEADPFYKEDE